MSAILDQPEVRSQVSKMSVDFYHASTDLGWIDERTELLRGIPVNKMSKSPVHEYFVAFFLRALEAVLPDGYFVCKERPLTTQDSEPEPDLMLVKGDELSFRHHHPTTALIVIEVAISTEERDRQKASVYADAEVSEYWLVLPEKRQIVVHSEPVQGCYRSVRIFMDEQFSSDVLKSFEITVPSCFD